MRTILRLSGQVTLSLVAAAYAVRGGIPYVALGRLPWWRSVLRWPQLKAFAVVSNSFVVEFGLFFVYALLVFFLMQYVVVKPVVLEKAK